MSNCGCGSTSILDEIAALFGPFIDDPDLGPIRRFIRKRYSPGGPPPQPWRQRRFLGRSIGEVLIGAAHLKVAAKMAGNEALAVAADRRITLMFDEDCARSISRSSSCRRSRFRPNRRRDRMSFPVNWTDFEMLVTTLVDYHAGLPDGALKDEIGGFVKQVASPG